MAETTVQDTFPEIFTLADRKALDEQHRYFRLTLTGLLAAVVAAVGSAISADVTINGFRYNIGGALAAVAFLVGIGVAGYLLITRPERVWYESRAAAESIKTLAWQYCVRGGIFNNADDLDARQFGRLVRRIVRGLRYAGLTTVGGNEAVTAGMREIRSLPIGERREIYRAQRIVDQSAYYATKARKNRNWARQWAFGAMALQAAGVVLAFLKAFNVLDADLLGVAATAAAGILAWVQTKDCQNLADSYVIAANELAAILGEAETHPEVLSPSEWSTFVRGGEQAISREHTLWLARRDPHLTPDDERATA